MATLLRRPIWHETPYRKGNSPEGIRRAAEADRPIDLDGHVTKDGIWANIHAGRPGREGFRYTAASVKAGVPKWKLNRLVGARVEAMSWAVVSTLETRGGDTIQTMGAAIRLAASLDVDTEIEPKGVPSVQAFINLRDVAEEAYGDGWRRHLLVKRLVNLPGWRTCLNRAKGRSIPTMAINVGSHRRGRRLPYTHYRV